MKINESLFMVSLRESFLEIIPFSIISSFFILLYMLINGLYPEHSILSPLSSITTVFQYILPFLIIISIASKFGKNYNIDYLYTGILAVILFLTISLKIDAQGEITYLKDKMFYAIFLPIITHYSFLYLSQRNIFKIITYDVANPQLKNSINALLPLILIFTAFAIVSPNLEKIATFFLEIINILINSLEIIELKIILQLILTHCITWLTSSFSTDSFLMFADIEIFPNISVQLYIYSFVLIGGVGAMLSLILAILMYSKNESHKKIAWYALPFSLFNISEILLFGLPIILNLSLLLPFITVPVVNFLTSYLFFQFVDINTVYESFSWTTPIFISGNILANHESYLFILLQIFNLILGVILYRPYLKRYDEDTSNIKEKLLEEKFGVQGIRIDEHFKQQKEVQYFSAHSKVIQDQIKINKLIDEILDGELYLYYQPQMNIKTNDYYGLESLIRFKNAQGEMTGPYFIPQLEDAGYSHVIDIWVIKQVKKDLELFNQKGFNPKISINLTPASISNNEIIDLLVDTLGEYNVYIEILERTFAQDDETFKLNLNILQYRGFKICVDDFGSGYSSLQYLHSLPASAIKIDKALLDNIEERNGKILYEHICKMCQDLGYDLIAEGVEDKAQIEFLKDCDVSIVQGYYFYKAITSEEVIKIYNQ